MTIQYYMRAFKTTVPTGYVDWIVNDQPDNIGTYSGYPTNSLINVIVTKTVSSKIENFLKARNSTDGYFFHINSYDLLHGDTDAPIPIPTKNTGIAIVRGSINGIIPRDYATIFWNENSQQWKFAYNTNGDGYTTGNSLSIGLRDAHLDGYITIGNNTSQSGLLRFPNNSIGATARNATNSDDIFIWSVDTTNTLQIGMSTNSITINGNNISLMSTAGSFANGNNVIFIANAITVPTTSPTIGGILYVDNGALKYVGSNGTITTIASA